MFKKITLVLILNMMSFMIFSQDNWMLKGYVKGMTSMQTAGTDGTIIIENSIYNRFDSNWYINDNFTFTMGLRNRIVAGNNVTLIPNYDEYVGRDTGFLDLTWVLANQTSWIGVSQFDRLMIDFTVDNLQITVGRQRINWGQTFVWNPNDLFNTYSYFDFDYEEKPGSDAVRIQYYIGESSKVELSTALNSDDKITSVALFRFNTRGFDIQFLGGIYTEDYYVAGGGWSGSIAGGGFSGEMTYFHPMNEVDSKESTLTFTLHYDYTFSNSLNLQFESLYNGFGADDLTTGLGEVLFMDSSPTNLFPTKVALFGSGAYELTPLTRITLAGMYGPEGNFLYVGPTITYSMSNTIELAGIGQYFTMDSADPTVADSGSALFVRLKWSF